MSNLFRLIVILLLGSSVASACTPPPAEGINLTWSPYAAVQVLPDSQVNTFSAVTNAVNNWNTADAPYCYTPTFTFGAGSGPTVTVAYGVPPIPPGTPPGTIIRGHTTITTVGRITSAATILNSNIPLTFPNVMTEVMAHELGHTMGLNDCNYPGCPIYSSVMEDQVPGTIAPQWTATVGQPGPTSCDLTVMIGVAYDYRCPPPPPPPGHCTCRDCGCGSPIIIDLSGKGFALTDWEQGVKFDIFGDGNPVQMGWTAPGADNAFLALPGADRLVHSSRQLFGNFTPQPTSATPNGFAALAVYDDPKNGGNGDGVIDAKDAVFASLRLWIDVNHDGISQPDELHTLPSLGVNSISLKYKEDDRTDQWGNVLRYRAQVNPGDATSTGRMAYDVFFVAELPPTTKNVPNPAGDKCQKVEMMAVKPAALR